MMLKLTLALVITLVFTTATTWAVGAIWNYYSNRGAVSSKITYLEKKVERADQRVQLQVDVIEERDREIKRLNKINSMKDAEIISRINGFDKLYEEFMRYKEYKRYMEKALKEHQEELYCLQDTYNTLLLAQEVDKALKPKVIKEGVPCTPEALGKPPIKLKEENPSLEQMQDFIDILNLLLGLLPEPHGVMINSSGEWVRVELKDITMETGPYIYVRGK